jgi:hypothetical protein
VNTFGDSTGDLGHQLLSLSLWESNAEGSACTLLIVGRDMVDPKGSKGTTVSDGAGVQAGNTIHVAMEDLVEEDWKALESKLEEEMAHEVSVFPENMPWRRQEG